MKKLLVILLCASPYLANSQQFRIIATGGVSNYQGDLTAKRFTFKNAKPMVGLGLSYEISNHILVRGMASYMTVKGRDQDNQLVNPRNLSFETKILEAQLAIEYNFLDIYEKGFTPYLFAGIAAFHFNPYAYDSLDNKVFLRPLGTEGQGLNAYPEKKLYANNQIAIPFGGGLKFSLTENLQLGIEVGLRKLFTDYLDDVSGTYADSATLYAGRGPKAIEFAYRGGEIHGNSAYPAEGSIRGNPKKKDWYYTTGITVSYLLGNGGAGGKGAGGRKSKLGCPTNVY